MYNNSFHNIMFECRKGSNRNSHIVSQFGPPPPGPTDFFRVLVERADGGGEFLPLTYTNSFFHLLFCGYNLFFRQLHPPDRTRATPLGLALFQQKQSGKMQFAFLCKFTY